jgi:uncharacterized protein
MPHTNRLIHETSPYLRQHAHNPVDWYPWGPEALEKARHENKAILLSIGYSACHWCHVMERESFEDETVARVMNEHFVNIKVDREERPDLDKIYQIAHQILTQRGGGWPLTMFLSPHDQTPFFGGTYFPKTPRYQLPGFVDLLERIARFYKDHADEVAQQSQQLRDIFARLEPTAATAPLSPDVIPQAAEQLMHQYDATHGGFGQAPKFPHPTSIELCLRVWARSRAAGTENIALLQVARHTLRAMALGGIHDQVGGGFCRYAVDERWMIPHFEKMLYDNGPLLALYADAYVITGESLFRDTALGIARWVEREMQAPAGGYYASLDADSEGHEGKYYVWKAAEIEALLTPAEWDVVRLRYRLHGTPNFEDRWHLHVDAEIDDIAARLACAATEVETTLSAAHRKLYAAREKRVRPGRDEKILTSWNALMIKGMARAAWRLDQPALLESAQRAFDYLRTQLWHDGQLLASAKDGTAHLNAYLDDHAFLIDAALELLQAQWRDNDLAFAVALADTLLARFEDRERGGFFFTSNDHERLVFRPKPTLDEATPSGNGVAAQVLARLGHLLGETRYLSAAERTLQALGGSIGEYPAGHATLLIAHDESLFPLQMVLVRADAKALTPWLAPARAGYLPWRMAVGIPKNATILPGVLAARHAKGAAAAYVCEGTQCSIPITTLADLTTKLQVAS